MKTYNKPVLECVELRVEERFAAGSPCTVTGSCTEQNYKTFQDRFSVVVNFY